MNSFSRIWLLAGLVFCVACGKKPDKKLAQTYFKMAFLELADEHKEHARYQSALQLVNQAIAQASKPEYIALKATILLHMGHTAASVAAFDQALALPADEYLKAQIMNNYACVLAQRGDREKAHKIWQELAGSAWYQTPEVAWVNLGKLHLDGKEPGRAKEAFKMAGLLSPNYLDAHFYCAVAAKAAGDKILARNELEMVLKLEPEHEGAMVLSQGL